MTLGFDPARRAPAPWRADYTVNKGEVALTVYRKRSAAPLAREAQRPVLFLVHGSSNSALRRSI